jgi:hypothetical protein
MESIVLKVADPSGFIADLKNTGLHFRNEMESSPGGRQIRSRIQTGSDRTVRTDC